MSKKSPPEQDPAIRVIMLPRDTNEHGTIFGGVILAHLDMAGAVEARKHGRHRLVTVAMNEVVFHAPVYVGDLVSYYVKTVKVGRTSVTVQVDVQATRRDGSAKAVPVTKAQIVYVAVDEGGRPIPVRG